MFELGQEAYCMVLSGLFLLHKRLARKLLILARS